MLAASLDFETYSEAGYEYNGDRWTTLRGLNKKGIQAVGAPVYAEHPSTKVLCLAYKIHGGETKSWRPGMDPPEELLQLVSVGGLIYAFNASFEYLIWHYCCHIKMGWPALPLEQMRDTAVIARYYGLPHSLSEVAKELPVIDKLETGKSLIQLFSIPPYRSMDDHPEKAKDMIEYNIVDTEAEYAVKQYLPGLPEDELNYWQMDQRINMRGCQIDMDAVEDLLAIYDDCITKINEELTTITGGAVSAISQLPNMKDFLWACGHPVDSLAEDAVNEILANLPNNAPDVVKRVLEIKNTYVKSSVKKLYSLKHRVSNDGRLRGAFYFYGGHTGRFSGRGPQPQNLPAGGPKVLKCLECGNHYRPELDNCPWCGTMEGFSAKEVDWNPDALENALEVAKYRDHIHFENLMGSPLDVVSGCLRGLFIAGPGKDLICSDYSAIEAVILACISECQWRIDVFNTHGKIYEMSASKISGVPFDVIIEYQKTTGEKHPLRNSIGKVAELASGYQGSVGAWKNFGADKFFDNDADILQSVKSWRKASPEIVDYWYGVQGAAVKAVKNPGLSVPYKTVSFYQAEDNTLYLTLPSGRHLCYRLAYIVTGDYSPVIRYWGKITGKSAFGWVDMYGGKFTENIVQAISRDILVFAMNNLEKAGYPIVLHVHDELTAEVPEGWGSVEEFESIISIMPEWAKGWPIKAKGGWRGKRFRK